jgi:hypothetical protein
MNAFKADVLAVMLQAQQSLTGQDWLDMSDATSAVTEVLRSLDNCIDVLREVDSDVGDEICRAINRGKAALYNAGGLPA